MIHIIFELKHHNTDTQQKEQYTCHAPLSTNIFLMKQLRNLTNTISIAESHITFIL